MILSNFYASVQVSQLAYGWVPVVCCSCLVSVCSRPWWCMPVVRNDHREDDIRCVCTNGIILQGVFQHNIGRWKWRWYRLVCGQWWVNHHIEQLQFSGNSSAEHCDKRWLRWSYSWEAIWIHHNQLPFQELLRTSERRCYSYEGE